MDWRGQRIVKIQDSRSSRRGSVVNESDQEPLGFGFNPQPCSLGQGSGIAMSCVVVSQMRLRSCVAVAVAEAGSYSSNSTPSLKTSICQGSGPRNGKKKKKTNQDSALRIFHKCFLSFLLQRSHNKNLETKYDDVYIRKTKVNSLHQSDSDVKDYIKTLREFPGGSEG